MNTTGEQVAIVCPGAKYENTTMQSKFNVGDVVVIKSGGSEMVALQSITNREILHIRTTWLEEDGFKCSKFVEGSFRTK